jgi:hypothetical protein
MQGYRARFVNVNGAACTCGSSQVCIYVYYIFTYIIYILYIYVYIHIHTYIHTYIRTYIHNIHIGEALEGGKAAAHTCGLLPAGVVALTGIPSYDMHASSSSYE